MSISTKCAVYLSKAQISLKPIHSDQICQEPNSNRNFIRTVKSQLDQIGRMHRLISGFARRRGYFVCFGSCTCSKSNSKGTDQNATRTLIGVVVDHLLNKYTCTQFIHPPNFYLVSVAGQAG